MTNEQLALLITAIGAILTYVNARATASSGAVSVLNETIKTQQELRKRDYEEFSTKLADERKEREDERKEFEEKLKKEREAREKLEASFERERVRYQGYIRTLVTSMQEANLPIPEWETE